MPEPGRPTRHTASQATIDPAVTTVYKEGRATVRHLRKARLVLASGLDAGREMEITKSRFCGGRSMINDLVLADKSISGTHFEIISQADGYLLRDLGSTNGTYIGDVRVREVFLRTNATFRAGYTDLKFIVTNEIVEILLSERDRFDSVIGESLKMREIFAILEKVAPSELTVLVTGETGTGKELVARAVHNASPRRARPFVVLDCSAIPRDLMESTVFGHEKGAFTGAVARKEGRFARAAGGTLFLDEIGELSPSTQVKLLRVLQEREIERLGGTQSVRVNVRLLAATHRPLEKLIEEGTFREDLFYRLNVFTIFAPPLRERKPDIMLLADHFLEKYSVEHGKHIKRISTPAIDMLTSYHWPGNVREIENTIERAVLVCEGGVIHPHHLPPTLQTAEASDTVPRVSLVETVSAFERDLIQDALKSARGNRALAARLLHTTERIVGYKIRKYRVDCSRFRS